jgi:hypothetical protein
MLKLILISIFLDKNGEPVVPKTAVAQSNMRAIGIDII